jgi:uncharacterized delta-60 repeat protein
MKRPLLIAARLAVIALVLFIQAARTNAAWGDFDTSFGFQGAAIDTITGYIPRSVAIQPDGKILVTGYRPLSRTSYRFFLRRYLANGQLDTAFGTNGAAIGPETNTPATDYRGDSIVVQPDSKIAVAGWANGYNAVWQFTSSGIAVTTFGDDGLKVLTNYPVSCSTHSRENSGYPELNIQTGKLLLSLGKGTGDTCRVALIRLTTRGAIDSQFGQLGESLTSVSGGYQGFGTVVETDGKITVGGVKFDDQFYKVLERKLANGQDDLTFSPPAVHYAGQDILPGLVKMANGKYVKRWSYYVSGGVISLSLEKYSSDGAKEATRSMTNWRPDNGCPDIFTNQNDGKLIVQSEGLLFRMNDELEYSSLEARDCSNLNGMTSFGRAAIQPDDKMVAAGVYNGYLILVRQMGD